MEKAIYLNPDGARLVYAMLGSCGNTACDEAMHKLFLSRVPISLGAFVDRESGHWLKPVFGSLKAYARTEGIHYLGAREVARYFGGRHHIEGMIRKAAVTHEGVNNLAVLMGYDAGLVLDVLLPVTDGHYRNGGVDLDLGEYVVANPKADGLPFYHRGLVVNLAIPPGDAVKMLEEQQKSQEFMRALKRLKGPVALPPGHLEALRLTCTK